MKKRIATILGAAIVLALTLHAATLSESQARKYLGEGALVIDVRTVGEYNTKHLTNVINIPLADLRTKLPERVKDKNQVLLLHCRSGQRSGTAETILREMGYTNAFNIGSFEKAEKICTEKK